MGGLNKFQRKSLAVKQSLPPKMASAIREEKKDETVNTAGSFNTRMLIRPSIAFILSLFYGRYFDNRIFMSNKELMRATMLSGSILASDYLGDFILPHLAVSKDHGIRELENMLYEPVMTGVLYTGSKYLMDGGEDTDQMLYDFAKGATLDLTAGLAEGGLKYLV